MKKRMICFMILAVCGACAFVHRRVIVAVMKGEPIPPAPQWHFWCKNRRED